MGSYNVPRDGDLAAIDALIAAVSRSAIADLRHGPGNGCGKPGRDYASAFAFLRRTNLLHRVCAAYDLDIATLEAAAAIAQQDAPVEQDQRAAGALTAQERG
jgi:hypothetical protein